MTTALISHIDCQSHIMPPGHPEQVARVQYILRALEDKDLLRVEAPLAQEADILRVHPPQYLAEIRQASPESGLVALDGDTHMSPGTYRAALRSAGGAVRAVDLVMSGEAQNVFVACRPPGHHAERSQPMGFCLFGNVSIAARHALDGHGLRRVAIVDFDVHHGNGTQDLVQDDARIFFCSSHQMPLYPGTGAAHETGAHGTVLNIPLRPGTGSDEFRQIYTNHVFPAVRDFEPELLIISAGFDAHRDDPLANLMFETSDFGWVTEQLCQLAADCCQGRVISCLEGGYNLDALADSASAHVDALIAAGS